MGYTTENTVWPAHPIPSSIQHLIERFYVLADLNSPEAGDRLAEEVFAEEATLMGVGSKFTGSQEIRRSRDNAWRVIETRRHEILKAYVADLEGRDVMLIGKVQMGLRNGKTVDSEFTARMVVDEASDESGSPRLSYSQVWADMGTLAAALK
ncbi:MAG: hypothetical protein M1819_000930 [Sarea resinae]|nr:MAG: hypothetical protein M1819_000930 [Sarea resinae]